MRPQDWGPTFGLEDGWTFSCNVLIHVAEQRQTAVNTGIMWPEADVRGWEGIRGVNGVPPLGSGEPDLFFLSL